jgi:HK97 family phage prohead protease
MTTIDERAATMRRIGDRLDRAPTVPEFLARLRERGQADTVLADAPESRLPAMAAGRVARDGLTRTIAFDLARDADDAADGLTIEGYGAVFDRTTEINSWEGKFEEKIRRGAFKKTLREQTPKMQFDHGHHPLLGGLPLGRWITAEEDARGLHLIGRMFSNWMTEPFRDAIAEGAIDGMSFRFSVVREKWSDGNGKEIKSESDLFDLLYFGSGDRGPITRELIEVKTPEAGPVVWPAYKDTEVGARSADGGTLILDLAALRQDPRQLADVTALIDAEVRQTEKRGIVETMAARVMDAESAQLIPPPTGPTVHTDPVHTASDVGAGGTEPPATERPAAEHVSRDTPPGTGSPAGEHSPSDQPRRRPANPTERREMIRREYRDVLDRTLALPAES